MERTVTIHDDIIKWKHFLRYWPFVWGIHQWIRTTKASNAELWCFLRFVPETTVQQTMETPVIWDDIALIMTSLLWSIITGIPSLVKWHLFILNHPPEHSPPGHLHGPTALSLLSLLWTPSMSKHSTICCQWHTNPTWGNHSSNGLNTLRRLGQNMNKINTFCHIKSCKYYWIN